MGRNKKFGTTHTLRRPFHNYAADGMYHLTMRVATEPNLFGALTADGMRLNQYGKIAQEELLRSTAIRAELHIDTYVIMPDHLHMAVCVSVSPDASLKTKRHRISTSTFQRRRKARDAWTLKHARRKGPRPRSLGAFVAAYKGVVAARINRLRGTQGRRVWRKSYHDRQIHNQRTLRIVRAYIAANPARGWKKLLDQSA